MVKHKNLDDSSMSSVSSAASDSASKSHGFALHRFVADHQLISGIVFSLTAFFFSCAIIAAIALTAPPVNVANSSQIALPDAGTLKSYIALPAAGTLKSWRCRTQIR